MNESDIADWNFSLQVEHDKFRNLGPVFSYFYDNKGNLQKIAIEDPQKVSKLRSKRNNRIAGLTEVGLPDEARLDRVDVALVNTTNPQDVEVVFVGGIHPDEHQSPTNLEKATSTAGEMANLVRAEIMEAHVLAAMQGRREHLAPLDEQEIDFLQAEDAFNLVVLPRNFVMVNNSKLLGLDIIAEAWTKAEQDQFRSAMDSLRDENGNKVDYQNELKLQKLFFKIRDLLNNQEKNEENERKIKIAKKTFEALKPILKKINSSKSFTLAKKINLNRQFPVNENATNLDQIISEFSWSEAKLLAEATRDLPNARIIVTLHEDPEYGHKDKGEGAELDSDQGFYFYDIHHSFMEDKDRELVLKLKDNLAIKLKEAGFYIKNGVDDPNDPALGFLAENGYISQAILNQNNQVIKSDGTYETAMALLGQKGLLKVERVFCFEIPGMISEERKRLLLSIVQEEFLVPFFKAKDIL